MKNLTDYPKNQWIEATGECEACHAIPEVMITWIDEHGDLGDVLFRIKHAPDCYEMYDLDGEETSGEENDVAGWTVSKKKLRLILKEAGLKEYEGFSKVANVAPCSVCERLVMGVPLILWSDDKGAEYHFCFTCAKKEGLLNALKIK